MRVTIFAREKNLQYSTKEHVYLHLYNPNMLFMYERVSVSFIPILERLKSNGFTIVRITNGFIFEIAPEDTFRIQLMLNEQQELELF
jgi:hypothetical protein